MIRCLAIFLSIVFASGVMANGTVIVVVGAEGEPAYGIEFAKWADRWVTAAEAGAMRVMQIGRDAPTGATTMPASPTSAPIPSTAPTSAPASAPATDRQKLQMFLQDQAALATEPLWLVLIGHGTSDPREAKFNLRGPDISDKELAEWLRPLRRPVAVINCFSASGPFLNRLSANNRIVVTAARSGSEIQFSRFGDHLSLAIGDASSDLDKDGQTSLLEAFIAASHKVEEFYKQSGRLTTEHALLDDNGDGLGVSADWFQGIRATRSAKTGAPVDGPRAHQWHLLLTPAEQGLRPDLRARRDELELAIEELRKKKTTLPEVEYYTRLEAILVDLARVYQQNENRR